MSDIVRQYEQFPIAFKLLGALLFVAGTSYMAWEEFMVPKLVVIEEKEQNRTTIEAELKALNNSLVSPVSLEEELSLANREFRRLVELLPQDSSVDRVLNDFASLSRVTGTEIREFIPSAELNALATIGGNGQAVVQPTGNTNTQTANQNKAVVELEETNAIGLQMKMQGTFPAIVSFLDMAMAIPRVVRIQDFEIINADKEVKLTQKPKLTFNGLFYAYFQKPGIADAAPENSEATPTGKSKSPTAAISKPAVDLNEVLDKSFSAKPANGEQR
ncbi:MAG: Pilus assembly protein PilO [Pseudomonadota bacterium]|jgi:Tfp pilus assembly protein PilO